MKSWIFFLLFLSLLVVCAIADDDDDGISLSLFLGKGRGGLERHFYRRSCPKAESLIRDITWNKVRNDAVLGARLLRIHYHDSFVRVLKTIPCI
ncbi:hypothetical protein LIER_02719 [Lithospermum erythrorhizon]|uniref:peroxidase n=1 Tax=Lithospermum erythrorhizon TaxID=34254 RepID=A0AAV3NT32_LITER